MDDPKQAANRQQILSYLMQVYQGRGVDQTMLENLPYEQLMRVYAEVVQAQQRQAAQAQQHQAAVAQQQAAAQQQVAAVQQQQAAAQQAQAQAQAHAQAQAQAQAAAQQAQVQAQAQALAQATAARQAQAVAAAAAAASAPTLTTATAVTGTMKSSSSELRPAENPLLILKLLLEQHPQINEWLKSVNHLGVVVSSPQHAAQFLQSLMDSQPNFKATIATLQQQLVAQESAANGAVAAAATAVSPKCTLTTATTAPTMAAVRSAPTSKRHSEKRSKKRSSKRDKKRKKKRRKSAAAAVSSTTDEEPTEDEGEDWRAPVKNKKSSRKRKRASEGSAAPRKRASISTPSTGGSVIFSPANSRYDVVSVTDMCSKPEAGGEAIATAPGGDVPMAAASASTEAAATQSAASQRYMPRMRLSLTFNPLKQVLKTVGKPETQGWFSLEKVFDALEIMERKEKAEFYMRRNRETRKKLESEMLATSGVVQKEGDETPKLYGAEAFINFLNDLCVICNGHDVNEEMVICEVCERGVHMRKCAGFDHCPEGDYFCPNCVGKKVATASSSESTVATETTSN